MTNNQHWFTWFKPSEQVTLTLESQS